MGRPTISFNEAKTFRNPATGEITRKFTFSFSEPLDESPDIHGNMEHFSVIEAFIKSMREDNESMIQNTSVKVYLPTEVTTKPETVSVEIKPLKDTTSSPSLPICNALAVNSDKQTFTLSLSNCTAQTYISLKTRFSEKYPLSQTSSNDEVVGRERRSSP